MTKRKLFVFGCSYATGEELLAHKLIELDDYRVSTAKDPRKFFKKLEQHNLTDKWEEIKKEQKLIAWPQLLADKLALECINLAESGNSLDKMLYQLYNEIYNGNVSKNDIILFSLTKATRNATFNKTVDSFQLPSLHWPVKTLLGVTDSGDTTSVINKNADRALLDWFTDERVLWDYIKNLKALESISFNLYTIPSMKNNFNTTNDLLERIYDDCSQNFITQKSLDDFGTERLAWGHPGKTAHQLYAEHLYEILR